MCIGGKENLHLSLTNFYKKTEWLERYFLWVAAEPVHHSILGVFIQRSERRNMIVSDNLLNHWLSNIENILCI